MNTTFNLKVTLVTVTLVTSILVHLKPHTVTQKLVNQINNPTTAPLFEKKDGWSLTSNTEGGRVAYCLLLPP